MEHQKDSLENMCLFKVQMNKRAERGQENENSPCYDCKGTDRYCANFVKLKYFDSREQGNQLR